MIIALTVNKFIFHFSFVFRVDFMCEVIRKPELVVVQLEHDVLTTLLKVSLIQLFHKHVSFK